MENLHEDAKYGIGEEASLIALQEEAKRTLFKIEGDATLPTTYRRRSIVHSEEDDYASEV